MAIAALIISILALLVSAPSIIYIRRQAIHAGEAVDIEKDRRRGERTPALVVEPVDRHHDNLNEHVAGIHLTNNAIFGLRDIAVEVVTDRPDKHAIIAISTDVGWAQRTTLPIAELAPGQTTTFRVVLAHAGDRSEYGVVLLTVHDAAGVGWPIEFELQFPSSPRLMVF